MGLIEELYYGNIKPMDKCLYQGTRYAKAAKRFSNNEQKLRDALSGEELKQFHELLEAGDEICSISILENFKSGFRLGVQMMCDSFIEDDGVFGDI